MTQPYRRSPGSTQLQPRQISPGSIQPQPNISPGSIQPYISPGSIQPQPYPPYPPQYPYPPYPPQYPPQYPYPPYPPYPSYPPPQQTGGCIQKWANMKLRDGRTLNVFVTSIDEKSLGGFLPSGQQVAIDLNEITFMTC